MVKSADELLPVDFGSIEGCCPDPRDKRIAELEGDLNVAHLQLKRIDEVLVGSYGEIPRLPVSTARRLLKNIAYIVKPF